MSLDKVERRTVGQDESRVVVETREDGKQMLTGYGAVFHQPGRAGCEYCLWDNVYERIAPNAFDTALGQRHDARGLFNHNPDYLLGRVANGTMRLSVDSVGLKYEIDLNPNDPDHQRVLEKVKRGDLTGSSFAFRATQVEWTDEGEREIRVIKNLDLYDTGPVTYPAYSGTTVAARDQAYTLEARSEHDAWKQTKADAEKREQELAAQLEAEKAAAELKELEAKVAAEQSAAEAMAAAEAEQVLAARRLAFRERQAKFHAHLAS